jgi:hypothetical protein
MGHLYQACPKRKTRRERESIETPTSQTWADIIVNGQRPQKQTHTDTREDKNPCGNQRASTVIPPSSIAEAPTTNDGQTPVHLLHGLKLQTNRIPVPLTSASNGMEQDPIPGWDEKKKNPQGT